MAHPPLTDVPAQPQKQTGSDALLISLCFLLAACTMLAVLAINRITPFGHGSLATMDASVQYLDLFSYFKDVLNGQNSLAYTFSKTLGGSGIAIYSYYLASPLNLLVALFPKPSLHTFFSLLVLLKIGLAAATCGFFLLHRFRGALSGVHVVLLSVCYALMQYNIAQASNIMWLEGVYMLPIVLLGVYRVTRERRTLLLSGAVGCSLLWNWYTGAINCLFACFWLVLELALHERERKRPRQSAKRWLLTGLRFGLSMALGVLMSAALLLPTLLSLANGRGGTDWGALSTAFVGNLHTVFYNFTLGSQSAKGSVSLYCGTYALLACAAYFFSAQAPVRRKVILTISLLMALLAFYWTPLIFLFSLLKSVTSYWYRYSYLGNFLIIFVAAHFFALPASRRPTPLWASGGLVTAGYLLFGLLIGKQSPGLVLASIGFALGVALVLTLWRRFRGPKARALMMAALFALVVGEAGYNATLLSAQYSLRDDTRYRRYAEQAEEQARQFAQSGDSFCRVNATHPFHTNAQNLTANYNEAAAYGFASLSGYTSDPSNVQLTMLDRLGYRQNGDNLCVVNTSLLPVDSLLSVQYVVSPIAVNGLQPAKGFAEYNRKQTYQNPYRLPMALRYRAPSAANTSGTAVQSNPFQYQEQLYTQLLGQPAQLYRPVPYSLQTEENALRYTLTLPEGNIALYGNLPWQTPINGEITVQGTRLTAYACWLSPSVFSVPTAPGQRQTVVSFTGEGAAKAMLAPQFYALDLDRFAKVTQTLQQKSAQAIQVANARLTCTTVAAAGESLLVSVAYEPGWSVFRNGQRVEPALFADCLVSIPLTAGENQIVMTYTPKGALAGLALSGFAVLMLIACHFHIRRNRAGRQHRRFKRRA